ncbi:unnamed protein product [Cladocopium goreaui]|uniref:Retrovirus-related Pol polyprotein from transposon RE2 (Retro element 2) (AtRE2) n=1 Tax=Cladocopium goreaui TaxID=2562237 RepID=A0A9P1DMQ1_9DINO|nr:unnamed protein product [Cladocopium goreaui]
MADEDKGTSSSYRVPVWSGDPSEWRGFKREMEWWIASLDQEHSRKYNIAARWALRQTGVVRARCEEYDPSELVGTAEVIGKDPESGEDVILQAADPFSGLRKLMRSLEESMGKTELDRKGELRKQFYQTIRRSPGERISAFCTRYRTLTGEMRREGIHLPGAELGWFLKDRLGLDALRLQLLETALGGREDYDHVEGEVLRLFRDLHVSDPLHRSKPQSFDSHKSYPLQRFLQQSNQPASTRSGPSSNSGASVKSFRTSSSYRFSKPGSVSLDPLLADPEDDAGQEEELLPDDAAEGALPSLDEVLQAEAEVLATEIQELEECGDVDPSILENLEEGVEKAAESLVTMREARARINDIRKDRGFGRPGAGSKMKIHGNQVQKKKTSTQCWDCGEFGHWGGDSQCQKPGAGLFKPKRAAKKPPSPQKHVKVMESLNTEHVVDDGDDSHEVMMVHHDSVPFVEALVSSKKEQPSVPGLAKDKVLVGALDSACNRTCAGDVWLQHYLQTLQKCPQHIQSLLMTAEENEMFRFGNGGTQTSRIRYRLPMMIGDNLVLVWVSVVKVPSLGLLLGRDFLDGIGAVISFTKQKLRPDFLDGKLIDLSQVAAGHFALKLMPHTWPRLDFGRWRRWGQDGILEQQMSSQEFEIFSLLLPDHLCDRRRHPLLPELTMESKKVKRSATAVAERWARMVMRAAARARWHALGLLLWLVQRPMLRFLPFPYPSTATTEQWQKQISDMMKGRIWPIKHGNYALAQNLCTAQSLQECSQFRNRVGWKLAFLEDPLLDGMIAARYMKGQAAKIRQAVIQEAKATADRLEQDQERLAAARQLVGPKGGLPALKGDLLRLATLLKLDVHDKMKVDELKELIRPMIDTLKGAGRPESHRPAPSSQVRPTPKSPPRSAPAATPTLPSQPAEVASMNGMLAQDVHQLLAEQERRFQAMISQTLQHMMSMQQNPMSQTTAAEAVRTFPEIYRMTEEEMDEINGLHQNELMQERMEVMYGEELDFMSAEELRAAQEDLGDGFRSPGVDGLRNPEADLLSQVKLDADDVKKGQAQLIAQAWQKHQRDQRLVSHGHVRAVLKAEWEKEMERNLNENFVTSITLSPEPPDPKQGVLVSEVFTAVQRIIKEAKKKGHSVGSALSLETGWNFLNRLDQKACKQVIAKEKPYLLVLAFPCGPWSALMRLNPAHDLAQKRAEGIQLIRFALELAEEQLKQGRHFLLENPLTAESWSVDELRQFLQRLECHQAIFDQCRFNLRGSSGLLHKKATKIVTSSEAIADRLDGKRCTRDHPHEQVLGGSKITSAAGHYTKELAREIIKGIEEEFEKQYGARRKPNNVLAVEGGDLEDDLDREIDPAVEMRDLHSSDDEIQIPEAQVRISANVEEAVRKLHCNTGHRSNKRLARALAIAGAPKEAILAAKTLKCSVCQEHRAPKARRPATLPTPKDTGDQVHIDIFQVEDITENKFFVVHVIDAVSRFQMAELLPDKSADSVVAFMKKRWMPIFGPARVLVADQGKEFVAWKFEEMAAQHSTLLYHTAVQAPWQNGVCEKGGGILKAILLALVKSQSLVGKDDMELAVQEAVMAYNGDMTDAGVTPAQAALGRQPKMVGDVLGDFGQRLAEHGLVETRPTIARQVAMREVAKLAMLRLHFSRGLRRAELARSRTPTVLETQQFQPGDIVYYYRMSKFNNKTSASKKRLSLKRWHGPGLLVALEGHSNGFISHKGQLVKAAMEHVRRASTMEQITSDEWELAIQDVVEAAVNDQRQQMPLEVEPPVEQVPAVAPSEGQLQQADAGVSSGVPLQPRELVAAALSQAPAAPSSNRTSLIGSSAAIGSAAPGTPVGHLFSTSSRRSSRVEAAMDRIASDEAAPPEVSRKRNPDVDLQTLYESTPLRAEELPIPEASVEQTTEHDALNVFRLANDGQHPLRQIAELAAKDRLDPFEAVAEDHGSWDGRWPLPSRSEWIAHGKAKALWPKGNNEVQAATARKEYKWKEMTNEQKAQFEVAAQSGWQVWVDNDAVEPLTETEAAEVRSRLKSKGEMHKILHPRYVYTDKHDGLRTPSNPLPVKASARLVVPGYQDLTAHNVRKDAPTCSRISFHLLLILTSSNLWNLLSADVKAAFLKGELFGPEERELFIGQIRSSCQGEPQLPLGLGQLARLRKGIFGLSDSPRRWYLRLHKSLTALGWERSTIDAATWFLWSSDRSSLDGMIVSHVDDLMMGGNARAEKSLEALGAELGFGSLERGSFVYCGKRVTQHADHSITLDMKEYHANLRPAPLAAHRKQTPDAPLTLSEQKQLRAVLGSLQWLVSQVRVDLGFSLSTLQGDKQIVSTLMKANSLVRQAKQNCDFALRYVPMDLKRCGILVVSDSSLGNVTKSGSADGDVVERVFSQSSYCIMLADENLMNGRPGKFNLIEARSHRLGRVCRSTFAAELLGTEEGLDAGQYCRGAFAELMGYPLDREMAEKSMEQIPMQLVTDAKDNYDKCNSDTPTYGSQKSLAFTIAWIRHMLRKDSTKLVWTATDNMFVDGGTKFMKLDHMARILQSNEWCVTFSPSFVKQPVKKQTKAVRPSDALPVGHPVKTEDPIFGHLIGLSDQPGWHDKGMYKVHVARNAKSYRTPEPRFQASKFPIRSTYAKFIDSNGHGEWRQLESQKPYTGLPNRHEAIGDVASILVTAYMPWVSSQQENLSAEESNACH